MQKNFVAFYSSLTQFSYYVINSKGPICLIKGLQRPDERTGNNIKEKATEIGPFVTKRTFGNLRNRLDFWKDQIIIFIEFFEKDLESCTNK